jgi:hypothetical protein
LRLVGAGSRKRNVAQKGERRQKEALSPEKPLQKKEKTGEGLLPILKSSQNGKNSKHKREG